MHICHDERRNPIDFGSRGSKVKVNFGILYIKPCGHDSDYSFCPITFKLHMHIRHDERRNPVDYGSWGQMSRSTLAPCEGMPRLALSSFNYINQLVRDTVLDHKYFSRIYQALVHDCNLLHKKKCCIYLCFSINNV